MHRTVCPLRFSFLWNTLYTYPWKDGQAELTWMAGCMPTIDVTKWAIPPHGITGLYRVVQKCPNLFLSELRHIPIKVANFWRTDSRDDRIMQMLRIVTLRGGYHYLIAHNYIINSTEGATWFNNVVLNILH